MSNVIHSYCSSSVYTAAYGWADTACLMLYTVTAALLFIQLPMGGQILHV